MPTNKDFTGPGSVAKIFEFHAKQELDASGQVPVIKFGSLSPAPNVIKK